MKGNILLLAFLFFSLAAGAQSLANALSKEHPVKSVDWGTRSISFVDGFWEMVAPQLQEQFTRELADSIEKYAMSMYYPSGFDDASKDHVKLYYVASFDNNFGGKFHGVKYILWVPYSENKDLWRYDNTRPNDFFLVFSKESVEVEE